MGDGQPKYLNSPDTPVFNKRRVLYNLNYARDKAFEKRRIVVCEGYMDVIAQAKYGFDYAVAPLGTALTEEQIAEAWKICPEPTLCFDGDNAGIHAAIRSIDRALPILKAGYSLKYVFLPDGMDPDEFLKAKGADEYEKALAWTKAHCKEGRDDNPEYVDFLGEKRRIKFTKEEKEKLRVSNNLTELDAKSAKELVAEGKKGITADFNGVISKSAVQQGAAVTQGMELFTLQNTDKVSVDINVSKYDYAKVKEGQTADITIGDKKYTGKVTKISHIATTNEKGSTLIAATVSIDKPDKDIFLGVDAKVKIYAEKAENVVTLPAGVVNIGKDGSFCYVLKDGVITRQDITTGISSEDSVEITDGIKAGDEVIEDLGSLEEGMTAEAAPADGDSAAETGETANE